MSVTLPTEFEQFVHQEVTSGRYRSEQDVVADALRLLQERDRRRKELRAEVQEGLNQLDRGEGTPLDVDQILIRGRQRLNQAT